MDKDSAALIVDHELRVARLARAAALLTGKDCRAAFLAGLFHDTGKLELSSKLFDGHDITTDEYEVIKKHAVGGFELLKDRMLFTGLCSGLHHQMSCGKGYGIDLKDIPKGLSMHTVKKLLDIAVIVAIADYIDAALTRDSKCKSSSGGPIKAALYKLYPDETKLIDVMARIAKNYYKKIL